MRTRDYENLIAAAGEAAPPAGPGPTLAPEPELAPASGEISAPAVPAAPEPPAAQRHAMPAPFDAAPFSPKYITENSIEGDFVDCGGATSSSSSRSRARRTVSPFSTPPPRKNHPS